MTINMISDIAHRLSVKKKKEKNRKEKFFMFLEETLGGGFDVPNVTKSQNLSTIYV